MNLKYISRCDIIERFRGPGVVKRFQAVVMMSSDSCLSFFIGKL